MRKTRYSLKEVKGLVENYQNLREVKSNHGVGLDILVRLADLDRAIYYLPPKEYQAVLLYGQLRSSSRVIEQALEVSRATLARRYDSGISWIVAFLNGEEVE